MRHCRRKSYQECYHIKQRQFSIKSHYHYLHSMISKLILIAAEPVFSQSFSRVEILPLRVSGSTSTSTRAQRLPSITNIGVSLGTTSTGALTETSTGLEKITINAGGQVIETYAGVVTTETTLFDPSTSRSSRTDTDSANPFICSAGTPADAPNANPGASPTRDSRTISGVPFNNPNPLASQVTAQGTVFERNAYGSSGDDANPIFAGTPLQLVPYPDRDMTGALLPNTTFPTCGG